MSRGGSWIVGAVAAALFAVVPQGCDQPEPHQVDENEQLAAEGAAMGLRPPRTRACRTVSGTVDERLDQCLAEVSLDLSPDARERVVSLADRGKLLVVGGDAGIDTVEAVGLSDVEGLRELLLGTDEEAVGAALRDAGVGLVVVHRDITGALDRDSVVLSRLAHHDYLEWFRLWRVTPEAMVYTVRTSASRVAPAVGEKLVAGLRARLAGTRPPKQTWNPGRVQLVASLRLQGQTLLYRTAQGSNLETVLDSLADGVTRRWDREVQILGLGRLEDRLDDLRIDLHVVMERGFVEPRDDWSLFDLWELGVDGVMFQNREGVKNRKYTYVPGAEAVAHSHRSVDEFLRYSVKQFDWNDQRPWRDTRTELEVVRTEHFMERDRGGGTGTVRMYRGMPEVSMDELTDETLRQMLVDGGEWWLRNMQPDGSFNYKYWPAQNRQSTEYNEVRHILATRDLSDTWRYTGDTRYLDGARKAMDWLMKYAVYGSDKPAGRLPHPKDGSMLFRYNNNQKLGTTAVALLGWVEWARGMSTRSEDANMRQMGKFVLDMQLDNGKFEPYYVPRGHSYYGQRNDIVPGEAALALGMLGEYFDDPKWMASFPKFLDFYEPWFRERAVQKRPTGRWPHDTYTNQTRLDLVQFGPWSVMASKQYYRLTGDERAAAFGLEVADWMIDHYQWTADRARLARLRRCGYFKMVERAARDAELLLLGGHGGRVRAGHPVRVPTGDRANSTEATRPVHPVSARSCSYDAMDSYFVPPSPRRCTGRHQVHHEREQGAHRLRRPRVVHGVAVSGRSSPRPGGRADPASVGRDRRRALRERPGRGGRRLMSDLKAFRDAVHEAWFTGRRVKDVRATPIQPGGRVEMRLFEQAEGQGRPHPRLRVSQPPASDPAPPPELALPPEPPTSAEAFRAWLDATLSSRRAGLTPSLGDGPSARYRQASVRVQRTAALVASVEGALDGWLQGGQLSSTVADACRYAVRRAEAELYAGSLQFDDDDSGTYHSFGKDAPFVHFLEAFLEQLPAEDSHAMSLLEGAQRTAVRNQRDQARAHLDYLMRHKYAYGGVHEGDVERSVGGFLIDRETRLVVTESVDSAHALRPQHVLLRIDPDAEHPHAGAWVARDGDRVVLQGVFDDPPTVDGDGVVEVESSELVELPVPDQQLTFRRAPHHARRRFGVRLDWDGRGFVDPAPIGWIDWAGHCDIKGILEALGVTLTGPSAPSVTEYRSDTDAIRVFDRDLLLEMVAAAMELGSTYVGLDGTRPVHLGVRRFGGARNDSLPDRLQLTGVTEGQGLRWPLGRGKDELTVTSVLVPVGPGEEEHPDHPGMVELDLSTAFLRDLPDANGLEFRSNPRFLKVVEGDYAVIDVSGARVAVRRIEHGFDPHTGAPTRVSVDSVVDLRDDAPRRQVLGTALKDAAERSVWRVELDRDLEQVIGTVLQFVRDPDTGLYQATERPEQAVRLRLKRPLEVTLSRESRLDDPALLDQVLARAVRHAEGICADTDWEAEVWNGVVTRLDVDKEAEDEQARLEQWRVHVVARFGEATLRYRVRRAADGAPEAWCPLPAKPGEQSCDFLWQDNPDVASKGRVGNRWVVNQAMKAREIVQVRWSPTTPGGWYVHDEHIKHTFEVLWCGLEGLSPASGGSPARWTIVHDNKRYVFDDEASWQRAVDGLRALRPSEAAPTGPIA